MLDVGSMLIHCSTDSYRFKLCEKLYFTLWEECLLIILNCTEIKSVRLLRMGLNSNLYFGHK